MPREFEYRGQMYLEQPFNELFDASTPFGTTRRRLFIDYLSTPEGTERRHHAGSDDPGTVWRSLSAEERTTFLSITHAMGQIVSTWPDGARPTLLDWVERVDEIKGAIANVDSGVEGGTSYRLYGKIPRQYFEHIRRKWVLNKTCLDPSIRYNGGSWLNHKEFCRPGKRFKDDKKLELKTTKVPSIQINFTDSTECVDIDIDFHPPGLGCHMEADNSNVLALLCERDHLEEYHRAYCNPGFTRR